MEKPRWTRVAQISLIVAVFALGALAGTYHFFARDLPSTARLESFEPSLKTQVYAADSTLIGELYAQNRELIPLEEMPTHLTDAIISIEDRKFYAHWGVDVFGIMRATIQNIRAGEVVQGASTITQQLARNLFVMFDQSLTRKIKEAILAVKIERAYSKDEILEMYLNQIYFGAGAYGVEAAAREFFDKRIHELTIGESALLAGLPKNPRDYSPHYHLDRAITRRALVLDAMVADHRLDRAEADSVSTADVVIAKEHSKPQFAAYFLEHVRRYMERKYGAERIYHDGLQIYTTLDPFLQHVAEDSMEANMQGLEKFRHYDQTKAQYDEAIELGEEPGLPKYLQCAVVAIDTHTGYVRAMVGGRDFKHSSFNRAVQAQRQPGSAFKPFIFVSALENGYTPADVLLDAPIVLDLPNGDIWKPHNFSKNFKGEITMRYALKKSINVPAVRVLLSIGPESAISYAHRLGIKSKLNPFYSLALGTSEVNLLEITSAYGTLAGGGVRSEPLFVKRVLDRNGKVLEENRVFREEVLSPQSSYMITNMLESVINEGTGRSARLMQFVEPAAGKTGTTDDYTDGWFVGFTPELVVGVWTGFDEKRSMGNNMTGAKVALPTWTDVMKAYYRDHKGNPFTPPEGIVQRVICEETGLLSSSHCTHFRREVFVDGTEPRRHCDRHLNSIGATPGYDTLESLDQQMWSDG